MRAAGGGGWLVKHAGGGRYGDTSLQSLLKA